MLLMKRLKRFTESPTACNTFATIHPPEGVTMSTDTLPSTQANKQSATLKQLLMSPGVQQQIATALPQHMKAERMVRAAMTAMLRTPDLAKCDQTSFMQAMLVLSQLGLEPDGRMAHLIPFNNNKAGRVDCQLIVDYKGLVALALRSGQVSTIHADVVCDNDEFEYDMGEIRRHSINWKKPRGDAYAAYARIVMKDGSVKCEVMSRDQIEAIRSRSRAGRSGPWVTDWEEMAKKTVFRRASKWLPLSPELRDIVDADDDQYEHQQHTIPVETLQDRPTSRVEAAKQLANRGRDVEPEQPSSESQDVVSEQEITRLLDAVQALIPDDKEERLRLYQSAGCDPLKKKWPVDGVAKVWAWVEEQHESRKQ